MRSWAYCDSSALAKRYIRERGRRGVLELLRRRACVSSTLLPVELRSAFRRRMSEGSLNPMDLPILLGRLAADRASWTLLPIGEEVMQAAEDLVGTHPLRALGAIHVASAKIFAARIPSPVMFLTADRRQAEVAAAVGLIVRLIR